MVIKFIGEFVVLFGNSKTQKILFKYSDKNGNTLFIRFLSKITVRTKLSFFLKTEFNWKIFNNSFFLLFYKSHTNDPISLNDERKYSAIFISNL